jgi:hypothetical protein
LSQGIVDAIAKSYLQGLDRRVERLADLSVPKIEVESADLIIPDCLEICRETA